MNVGAEWIVDAFGCSSASLSDLPTLQSVCERIITELDLHVVGKPLWQQFPAPGGITGLFLLTESHLACHTYPESGMATFNLYCCKVRPDWRWQERLSEMLDAKRVTVRFVERGAVEEEEGKERRGEREKGRKGEGEMEKVTASKIQFHP
ncbi:MAG: S-adenosylmethionine decarboxylase [Acidobacteriota bacterium]